MIKGIIFDFDGVIVESVDIKTKAFLKLYEEYSENVKNKVLNHHLANGGMSRYEKFRYYHKEYLNIQLNDKEVAQLSNLFSKLVVKKVVDAPFVSGANDFLQKYNKKYDFFISSATPEVEIRDIAHKKIINKYFKGIYGSPESKYSHIENIIRLYSYNRNEVVFIGDAQNDLNAARKSGIKFIARILNNNSVLKNEEYLMDNLDELISIIKLI